MQASYSSSNLKICTRSCKMYNMKNSAGYMLGPVKVGKNKGQNFFMLCEKNFSVQQPKHNALNIRVSNNLGIVICC